MPVEAILEAADEIPGILNHDNCLLSLTDVSCTTHWHKGNSGPLGANVDVNRGKYNIEAKSATYKMRNMKTQVRFVQRALAGVPSRLWALVNSLG